MWVLGCANSIQYTPLPVDPAWELLFVTGQGNIHVNAADSAVTHCIYQSAAQVLLPRCSPDRSRVAFYQFSDRRGALKVVKVKGRASEQNRKWAETLAEIEGPVGHRMALFPPVWDADGQSVLFVDQGGVYRIAMDRQHERVVSQDGIVALSIAPDWKRMAYANGERIFLANMDGTDIDSVTTSTAAISGKQEVQPIAFSPGGRRIAYAAGRFLFILDLATMKAREVFDTEDPIYWIQWLPGQERLLFTTGQSILNLRTSMSATPFRVEHGSYTLFSVGTNGRGLRRLFEVDEVDAHLAQPALSHDGSYVTLVSGDDATPSIVVLAMDTPRMSTLTPTGSSDHPTWLPVAPLSTGAAERPCPVFVVYPLR
jgi:Tol biopolymer transport system component